MTEYRFTAECTISVGLTIEAVALKEAVEKMREAGMRTFCHQCAKESEDEWSCSELDGEPRLIECEDDDGNELLNEVRAIEAELDEGGAT